MKRSLALIGFLLLTVSAWAESSRIVKIEIISDPEAPIEQVRRLLTVQEGDWFQEAELERSLTLLRKWGRFKEVHAETDRVEGGVELTLTLVEGVPVRDILISGNYPYLSRRLRRKIAVHPGDFFDPEFAARQTKQLEDFYEREGYFGTQVELMIEADPVSEEGVRLHYQIDKKDRYRWGKIQVEGNTVFPRGHFTSALNPLLLYKPARLRSALEKLRRGYQKRGYLQARVRATEILKEDQAKKVHVRLQVREGDLVKVRFNGNRLVSARTFKKIIPLYTEGDTSFTAIQASVEEMLHYYHDHGFQEAKVIGKKGKQGETTTLVEFTIHEGPRTRVKEIVITGNEKVRSRKLKKHLVTQEEGILEDGYYRPETVTEDALNLPQLYHQWGYEEAKLLDQQIRLSPLRDKADILFAVEENEPTRIRSITFVGNQVMPIEKLQRQIKLESGDLLDHELLKADQTALQNYYSDKGFPYVEVTPLLERQGQEVDVSFQLTEGIPVTVGEILVIGNRRTTQRAIERTLDLKTGKPFSVRKLLRSEASLRRGGVYRMVDIEPIGLAEQPPVLPLLVKLEENPNMFVDLEAGYDTDDKFTGSTALHLNNLFGLAKRGTFRLTGGQDIQKGELNFIDPRFLGFGIEMTAGGLLAAEQRPGFSTVDAGGRVSFLHEFTAQTALLTKYELTRTFFQSVTDPTEASTQDHTTSKVGASVNYDSRDSFSDPRRGISALIGADVSNKIIASGFNFIRPNGSIAHFYGVGPRVTFLNYLRAEGIHVFGGDILTRDERLFLGGDYSVRGFGQDAIGPLDASGDPAGGLLLLLHTLEIQAKIKGDFKFATFADSGTLTDSFSGIGLASTRHAAGAGIRYITPIGALRLDYGVKLDRQPNESFGRLHFAFGYAF